MIQTRLVGLHFESSNGTARVRGRVVGRMEPGIYLCDIDGRLYLHEIADMIGWTFSQEAAP